ncbi:MAG: tetratricopeptide repeat protein [Acidobacteria bacterium]|nr:tetratricopeptide repeat protein [Acidobacteriota bacterium]
MKTIQILIAAATILPGFAADLDRGIELYNSGKSAEAEKELRAFVSENGDNARGRLYLGYALLELSKTSDAGTEIKKADELESTPESRLGLAWVAAQNKQWDEAESAVENAGGDDLEFVRGQIHLNKSRWQAAAKDLESALQKKPFRAYAHYYAGLAYNGMKRPDKMLTHFEQFLKMKPDAPEARKVRAVVNTGK